MVRRSLQLVAQMTSENIRLMSLSLLSILDWCVNKLSIIIIIHGTVLAGNIGCHQIFILHPHYTSVWCENRRNI